MCDFTNSVFSPVWPGLTCIAGCCLLAAGCLGGVQQTIWALWVTGKHSVENMVFFRETPTILLWVVQLSSLWMLLNLLKNKNHVFDSGWSMQSQAQEAELHLLAVYTLEGFCSNSRDHRNNIWTLFGAKTADDTKWEGSAIDCIQLQSDQLNRLLVRVKNTVGWRMTWKSIH